MTVFFYYRLGCPDFSQPLTQPTPNDGFSKSLFFSDNVIFTGHPRFRYDTINISTLKLLSFYQSTYTKCKVTQIFKI